MRWFAIFASLLVLAGSARASAPDDRYLDIYNEILQADTLRQSGQSREAAERYVEAQSALQKLKEENPTWNTAIVSFRLDYLSDQIHNLSKSLPAPAAPPAKAPAPVPPPVQPASEAAAMQEQIRSLTAANSELQNKLKEALSVQPAPVSAAELGKAQEKILTLEKEKVLLSVALEQAKAAKAQAAPAPEADKSANQLAEANKALAEAKEKIAAQDTEIDALKAEQRPKRSKGRAAEKEVEQLRNRLAVLEAKAVPYTPEELAAMKETKTPAASQLPAPGQPETPATPPEAKHIVHSMKDLPPGAGALMAEADRDTMSRDYAGAEEKFKQILRQDENNVFVLAHLASAQLALNQMADCEKTLNHSLSLDKDDPASLYTLGLLRFRQDKLDDALDALSRSAKYSPTNAGTHYYLGSVLATKGLRYPAETAFRKALELDPTYADAHYGLAWVYASEKPPATALARWHYQKAVDDGHDKNPDLEKLLGPVPAAAP